MNNINIEGFHGSYYVPTINFDAQNGICEISGESYLEDTVAFFSPLIDWLTEFLETQDKPLIFNFNLDYYNTSSSKYIVDILALLKKYQEKGKNITVNWHYNESSEDADEEIEEVEDFMLETGMKINLIPYTK
jgi:hypothetical protein